MPKQKTPPDPSHPVVVAINFILNERKKPDGTRWSESALSLAAGLTRSHVTGILAGGWDVNKIALSTILGLARAGNLNPGWLITGKGPRDGFEESVSPELLQQALEFVAWRAANASTHPVTPTADKSGRRPKSTHAAIDVDKPVPKAKKR